MLTEQEFRNKITVISFALMVSVVYIHAYNVGIYGLSPVSGLVYWLESYAYFLQGACVPFFYLISGYLFFQNFRWDKLAEKYRSRARSIILPYFLWCTIYYLAYVCLTGIPSVYAHMNREQVPLSLETWLRWLWKEQYYTLWFLKELIPMILLAPVICILLKGKGRWKNFGLLFLAAVYLEEQGVFSVPWNPFNLYYLTGAFIGMNYREAPRWDGTGIRVGAAACLAVQLLYAGYCVAAGRSWGTPFILLLCASIWYASNIFRWRHAPKWWMGLSFYCYCLHDLILEALEKLMLVLGGKSSFAALADYLCMPVLTIAICLLSAEILKKYCSSVFVLLSGGRG